MSGWVQLAANKRPEAQANLLESLAIYRQIGQKDELGQSLALLGHCAYLAGENELAQDYLIEAMETAVSIQAFMPLMIALPVQAHLFDQAAQPTDAAHLRRIITAYPLVTRSCWFADLVGPIATGTEGKRKGELTAVVTDRQQRFIDQPR